MENASKALIIAGAILLSILIIALGIFIFNQAKNATNTNQLDAVAIRTFNDPISQYAGDSVQGSSVKALITDLIANVATNGGAAEKLPTVNFTALDGNTKTATGDTDAAKDNATYKTGLQDIRKAIANTHNYYVNCDETNDSGLISKVEIFYTKP